MAADLTETLAHPAWAQDAFFYHIYPLGLCGAPWRNDFRSEPEPRLNQLQDWLQHLRDLGVNAVYIGPLWEAGSHGYDTDAGRMSGSSGPLRMTIRRNHPPFTWRMRNDPSPGPGDRGARGRRVLEPHRAEHRCSEGEGCAGRGREGANEGVAEARDELAYRVTLPDGPAG